jgi:hypothetical protein
MGDPLRLTSLPLDSRLLAALTMVLPIVVGFRDPFQPDVPSLLLHGAAATRVVLAAAGWPALHAARLDVVEALQCE